MDSMKELLALYKKVTGNYRPMLDGERYLTDREVSEILMVNLVRARCQFRLLEDMEARQGEMDAILEELIAGYLKHHSIP